MDQNRRPSDEPQQVRLSADDMKRGVIRIQKRIEKLQAFDPASVTKRWDAEVMAVQAAIDETLVFDHNTVEYQRYKRAAELDRGPVVMGRPAPLAQVRQLLAEGKRASLALLNQAVKGLEEKVAEQRESASTAGRREAVNSETCPRSL